MLDSILSSGAGLDIWKILILVLVSLVLGAAVAITYKLTEKNYSKNYAFMLVILPAAVCAVISIVSGNLGTGIAIAGAFSLVRFRSTPGNGKEIAIVFADMAIGLAAATGYIVFTVILAAILCVVLFVLTMSPFCKDKAREKTVKIDIPEDLNYEDVFTEIFAKYTEEVTLEHVKTTNLGSMFELRYQVTMRKGVSEKEMIDELRTRNGNLPISVGIKSAKSEL